MISSDADARTLFWRITGRVQGVGFRWFVANEARSLGVSGWVRNTESGEVLVLATGTAGKLDQLRALLRRGPPGARVTAIEELLDEPPTPAHVPFSIVR